MTCPLCGLPVVRCVQCRDPWHAKDMDAVGLCPACAWEAT
jgi:predicted RNA-binding Zn-ribbon protein involved in translation (DUF1610 family)